DAELPEQRLHAESARLVRNDRDHALAELRMLHQQGQALDEGHGARQLAIAGAFEQLLEIFERRRLDAAGGDGAAGRVAAELAAALVQVRHLRAVLRGPEELRVARRLVWDGDLEARLEVRDLLLVELLLLVADVAPLARLAEAV